MILRKLCITPLWSVVYSIAQEVLPQTINRSRRKEIVKFKVIHKLLEVNVKNAWSLIVRLTFTWITQLIKSQLIQCIRTVYFLS